jgi:hypothetical protein
VKKFLYIVTNFLLKKFLYIVTNFLIQLKKVKLPEAAAGAAIRIDGAERNIFGSATRVLVMPHLHGHIGSLQQFYKYRYRDKTLLMCLQCQQTNIQYMYRTLLTVSRSLPTTVTTAR